MLLTDLGSRLYLAELSEGSVDHLYDDALEALTRLQAGGDPATPLLPPYDSALLHREMELFREWFLTRHLGLALKAGEQRILDETFATLVRNALEQPQVCVHRDYHARNLMLAQPNPGILDFQDAVVGPVTYDLVSLLRDCYIAWDPGRVTDWALGYLPLAIQSGIMPEVEPGRFLRWFDLMGVQRHLKACGIFARLNRRDGKSHYLADIPRTLGYVQAMTECYPELAELHGLLQHRKLAVVVAT